MIEQGIIIESLFTSGINHNVDELLVGVLTQIRLRRRKRDKNRNNNISKVRDQF